MLIYGSLQKVNGWMDGHDKELYRYLVVPSVQMLGHLSIHLLYLPGQTLKRY